MRTHQEGILSCREQCDRMGGLPSEYLATWLLESWRTFRRRYGKFSAKAPGPTARDRSMTPKGLDPSRMSRDERLAELAEILAAGFLRLQARESARNSRDLREFPIPLDFAARPSVHESPERPAGENQ